METHDESDYKENPSLQIILRNFHCYKCSITLNSLDSFTSHINDVHNMSNENSCNTKLASRRRRKNSSNNSISHTSSQNQRKKSTLVKKAPLRPSNINPSRAALRQLQDYMHCVKCFTTFYELPQLLKHFKGCQTQINSSFTDYKRNENSDCFMKSEQEILNCNPVENNEEKDPIEAEIDSTYLFPGDKQKIPVAETEAFEAGKVKAEGSQEERTGSNIEEPWESGVDDGSNDTNYDPEDDANFEPEDDALDSHCSDSSANSKSKGKMGTTAKKKTDTNCNNAPSGNLDVDLKVDVAPVLPFACAVCGNRYKTKDNLRNHTTSKHGGAKLTCDLCPFTTTLRGNLYPHYKRRHPQFKKIYKCYKAEGKCQEAFTTVAELRGHIKKVHKKVRKVTYCPVESCTRKFPYRFQMIDHLNEHKDLKPHMCEVCGDSFATIVKLRCHRYVHQEPTIKCPDCDRMFKRKEDLKNHAFSHAGERYPCTVPGCQSTFMSSKRIAAHIRTAHEGVRVLCQICGASYKSQGAYDRHQKVHRGEKTHRCSFYPCEKSFIQSFDLRRHERTHMGDQGKVNPCQFCDKKFSSSTSRDRHEQTHTKLRPYKCAFCDSAFPDNRPLKKHVTSTHAGEFEFDLNIPATYQAHPPHQAPGRQEEPSGGLESQGE